MSRAKPNNFAILKEYIDTTLRVVLFVVFDSLIKKINTLFLLVMCRYSYLIARENFSIGHLWQV